METVRLRKLQPSHVERLLEALIARSNLAPEGAYQVRDMSSAPKELRRLAKLAVKSGRACTCWTNGSSAWLITAEMILPLSRERGTTVLQADVYDEDGPRDSGLWMPDRDGKWSRCNDLFRSHPM